jgi:hypothetical protein
VERRSGHTALGFENYLKELEDEELCTKITKHGHIARDMCFGGTVLF